MSTEHEEGWFSAAELAAFGTAAGLPGSERGCKKKAQREGWPSRTVPGKGGRSGELTLYLPPRPLLAAINELGGASEPVASARYPLQADTLVARHMASEPPPQSVTDILRGQDDYDTWAETVQIRELFAPVRYFRHARVSAGYGAQNTDTQPDALLFSKAFLRTIGARPANLFLVRVKGDSMLPTLQAGWTVMLDASRTQVSSGIYVVRLGGEEMVKRLEARPGGIVKVISDNRVYDEYEIDLSRDGNDFAVLGEVVWFAGLVR